MKLLVPVDGSPASIEAVKKSLEIARKYDFSIKLISVVDFIEEGFLVAMKENRNKLLEEILEKFDFSSIDTEKEVLVGQPYMEILKIAKDEKFDLIVMGNRGFSKIKSFFLGSVAERVISGASCPVLVIHKEADF